MTDISELIASVYNRVYALVDHNIYNTLEKRYEFKKQIILADKFLTKNEKSVLICLLNIKFDNDKVLFNRGTKRICENCNQECLAKSYCEYCIRNHLKKNFSNWASGNTNIDDLIQNCQIDSYAPYNIVEWISYDNLQNIKYLTEGGYSEIYTANWIDGAYHDWDNKKQRLKRYGMLKVILKKLENVESANRSWFDECKSHLSITNKWSSIVQCYGLTKDPSDGNYMLVMKQMDMDLRKYLQQNFHKLNWKERINIMSNIIEALYRIHNENAIHRDLHSKNILLSTEIRAFYISDLGFCGPANKPLNGIYGNLPYIAPEVIANKETTFASDIYSIAMLMWEISSGQPPFINLEHDCDLALRIINGMRPKIIPRTPYEYRILMEQCWDADPVKRPKIDYLLNEIEKMKRLYHQNENDEQQINNEVCITNYYTDSSSVNSLVESLSKVHIFENLPVPRNASAEEQKEYQSIQHNLSIPSEIEDFVFKRTEHQIGQYDLTIIKPDNSKSKRIYFDADEKKEDIIKSKKIKLSENKGKFQYSQMNYVTNNNVMEDDDISNNPNFHSEDQEELEIPEDI
ncbi:kinase-like domain-containing protein [Rhizophagus irregularis DAOM 181602=DAOM 197198]|nr:kinase-like domain-containing protein [Rhizophagus irregularis DAOM 181602=DAOM 197198]